MMYDLIISISLIAVMYIFILLILIFWNNENIK